MAQRQGLLLGRHLSPVQYKGTIILDYIERLSAAKESQESNLRRLKEALISSGEWMAEKLFPEHFSHKLDDTKPVPENAIFDYSEVEWKMPSNAKDEYLQLMAQVAGARNGSFTGDSQWMRDANDGWR